MADEKIKMEELELNEDELDVVSGGTGRNMGIPNYLPGDGHQIPDSFKPLPEAQV